jgi:hypothetical protein
MEDKMVNSSYFNQAIEDIIIFDLSEKYSNDGGKSTIYGYELAGYDKEKFESEGSTWIVYIYDCMNDYYHKNKKDIDKRARKMLLQGIK